MISGKSAIRAYWRTATIALLLATATFGTYWPVVHHQFINFDDLGYIIQNPHVRAGFSWANVQWAFTSGYGSNWHPLTWLSHMLDCQLYSLNAGEHHLTNLLLHTTNTVLLFLLLKQMTGALWRSAFIAALFALHPMHVESVAWVAERKDVLSTFFFLLTLLAYVRFVQSSRDPVVGHNVQSQQNQLLESTGRSPKSRARSPEPSVQSSGPAIRNTQHISHSRFQVSLWYILALLFFALGLMSKPMLVTLPFILLLLDYWPLARFRLLPNRNSETPTLQQSDTPILRLFFEKLPFFGLSVASSTVTYLVQEHGGAVAAMSVLPLGQRIPNALVSYAVYFEKLFWPTNLANYYPPREAFPLWASGSASLFILLVSALTLLVIRKQPYVAVGWFWFVGTLVPVIGFVQVGLQSMADRYTYIPYIGLFIALTWSIPNLVEGMKASARRVFVWFAAFAILGACSVLSAAQVRLWKDSETLYRHTLSVTGPNPITQGNLGTALLEVRRFDEAIAHFKEAVRLKPDYAEALSNWAFALALQGKLDEAVPKYRESLALKPKNVRAHYTLGQALLLQGKRSEAMAEFDIALDLDHDFTPALNDLAWILATDPEPQVRDRSQAVRLAEHACALTGFQNPLFVGTLAAAYAEAGRFDDAVQMAEKARSFANAIGQKNVADRNEQLLQFYRAGKPFHQSPVEKHEAANSQP